MIVSNEPDFPVDDAACKANTGKAFSEWFAELDRIDALGMGRRETVRWIYETIGSTDPWWPVTLAVEYEKAKGLVKKDGLPEGYTICVTKSVKAPVSRVYATWTDPAKFAEMFGDSGTQNVVEGGNIACKGGCKGTFSRIRPDKDLRFTWEHPGCTAPMTVDVQFQDVGGKTTMNVMTSRIQSRGEADSLRVSWTAALDRLKQMAGA